MSSLFVSTRSCFLVAGLAFLVGCTGGGGDAPKTIKVGGKITLGGGEWPQKATMSFVPVAGAAGATTIHSATADVQKDGTFAASTFDVGDGLVPGKYDVTLQCWDSDQTQNPNAKSLVPKEYESSSTTPLKVDVPAGGPAITVTWDVPKA